MERQCWAYLSSRDLSSLVPVRGSAVGLSSQARTSPFRSPARYAADGFFTSLNLTDLERASKAAVQPVPDWRLSDAKSTASSTVSLVPPPDVAISFLCFPIDCLRSARQRAFDDEIKTARHT